MKPKIDYEARFHYALRAILSYMTTAQLRRESEKRYSLEYGEALEMAYENVRGEAQAALKGYRPKKAKPVLENAGTVTAPAARSPLPSVVNSGDRVPNSPPLLLSVARHELDQEMQTPLTRSDPPRTAESETTQPLSGRSDISSRTENP